MSALIWGREPALDVTTVCKFRHLPERYDLCRLLFEAIGEYLQD